MVQGASHRAGLLGETGFPRPFYAAQSQLLLKASTSRVVSSVASLYNDHLVSFYV